MAVGVALLAGCAAWPARPPVAGINRSVERAAPATVPGFEWRRVPAEIRFGMGDAMLPTLAHAPRIRRGQPLEVRVFSYGGGCEAPGGAQVRVEGNEARIEAWDYQRTPLEGDPRDMVCTTALGTWHRTVWVTFAERGLGVIVVSGSGHGRTGPDGEPARVMGYVAVE